MVLSPLTVEERGGSETLTELIKIPNLKNGDADIWSWGSTWLSVPALKGFAVLLLLYVSH